MLFLSKLVPLFLYPLGLALLAGVGALILSFRWRRVARFVLAAALAMLWVASTPVFANWLYARLEAKVPPVAVEVLPEADVAVVLGGLIGQPLPPRIAPDAGEPVDRALHAARLYRAGKVGAILVAGGNIPWQAFVAPEAELVADLLTELGVPRQAIAIEPQSRNTRENAINSAALMDQQGWRTALLVTSGAHMPRALAVFQRAGMAVTPASTDIRVRYPLYESVLDFLPDAGALERTSAAIKEYLGLFYYRLRGWV